MRLSVNSPDFIKLNRPVIAKRSFDAGTAYILVAEAARIVSAAWGSDLMGASATIAAALYGPCVWYMGMRSVDGFSSKGKS